MKRPFTFTFIRHHGKTHNHRPRGDTTVEGADKHTQKHRRGPTQGGGSVKAAKDDRRGAELLLTDPARANEYEVLLTWT